MNTTPGWLIAIGILAQCLGVVLLHVGFSSLDKEPKKSSPELWEIVCDGAGRYGFINFDGEVHTIDYPTREEAVVARDEKKAWSDAYQAGLLNGQIEAQQKAKAARQARFKKCP